jgi:hypothetical protein
VPAHSFCDTFSGGGMRNRFGWIFFLASFFTVSLFGQTIASSTALGSEYRKGVGILQSSGGDIFVLSQEYVMGPRQTVVPTDVVVTKLAPGGKSLLYESRIYVGPFASAPPSFALDAAENIYVAVNVPNASLTTTAGAFQSTPPGGDDIYVAKFDPAGALVAATYLGGSGSDFAYSIAVDSNKDVIVAGITTSNDFPLHNAVKSSISGASDGFVAKISADFSNIIYSTYWGGSSNDSIRKVVADGTGGTYLFGLTNSQDLSEKSPIFSVCGAPPITQVFLAKLGSSGDLLFSSYIYNSQATCSDSPVGEDLAVDALGNAFIFFSSGNDSQPQTLIRIDSSLSTVNSYTLSSTGFNNPRMALDGNDNIYFTLQQSPDSDSLFLPVCGSSYLDSTTSTGATRFHIALCGVAENLMSSADGKLYIVGEGPDYLINPTLSSVNLSPAQYQLYLKAVSFAPGSTIGYSAAETTFVTQRVGSSVSQQLSLKNFGTDALNTVNVSITGDFTQTNDCTAGMVGNGGGCAVDITFSPSSVGPRIGALTISSAAEGSPTIIPLSGVGAVPNVSLSPSALTFPSIAIGQTGQKQTVTLSNTGGVALSISRISTSGDFAETNDCSTSLPANSSCAIEVSFTPSSSGTRSGTLSITDDAVGSPHTVALSGNGGGNGFLLSSSDPAPSATVLAGQTANYALTLKSVGTFAGTVTYSCSTTATLSSCVVSPSSTVVSGPGNSSLQVSVTTTAQTTSARSRSVRGWYATLAFALISVGCVWIVPTRNRRIRVGTSSLVLVFMVIALQACGGGGTSPKGPTVHAGTAAGNYTVTVTATSGSLTQTMNLALIVN